MLKYRLEALLILSLLLLIGQLGWPRFFDWWRRPTPGHTGIDRFESTSLAEEYLVYLPPGYGTGSLPMVVFLHGAGGRGKDLKALRRNVPVDAMLTGSALPTVIVAPQCLPNSHWQPDAVIAFVEHVASTYRVDRQRIYLIGYSMGGYGAWRTAGAHPELFAAIVPICGGGEPGDAEALSGIPIWAFHGAQDKTVPVAESERMVDAIRSAGGEPRLTVIPNAGHGISQIVCERRDLWVWLLQQRRAK